MMNNKKRPLPVPMPNGLKSNTENMDITHTPLFDNNTNRADLSRADKEKTAPSYDLIGLIFDQLDNEDLTQNPFETQEFQKLYNSFCDEYIDTMRDIDYDKGEECWDNLIRIISLLKETAFRVGFKECVKVKRYITDLEEREQ